MSLGNGIAIAGIWVGVGLVGLGGAAPGMHIVLVAACAMFATLFAKV